MTRILMILSLTTLIFLIGAGSGMKPGNEVEEGYISLSPGSPVEYLEQAELVLLNQSVIDKERRVIELTVRGIHYASKQGENALAASGCILLASQTTDPKNQGWLWDLALILDPSREHEWGRIMSMRSEGQQALDLEAMRCLTAIRFHQMPIGEELFSKRATREHILRAGESVGINRDELGVLIQQEIDRANSDACRGRLYVADRTRQVDRVVCPDHIRAVGMCANDEELSSFLRVEMALINVQPQSWHVSVGMGANKPLRVPAVEDLERMYGVQTDKPFYRDGRWVASP